MDVYTARVLDPPFAGKQWDYGGAYSFANFDVSGGVTLRITSPRSLRNTVVRPQSPAVKIKVADEHTLLLTLDGPRKLSIEPDGKKGPLLLFANPLEKDPPQAKDAGRDLLRPRNPQGGVDHRPRQPDALPCRRRGRPRGDRRPGNAHPHLRPRHPRRFGLRVARRGRTLTRSASMATDVELSGITVRGSPHWTIVPRRQPACHDPQREALQLPRAER